MARIRTVKPEFWTDDLLGSLSRDARLLFVGTWTHADDEGLLRWSAAFIKGAVFPFDDDLSIKDVQKLMTELEQSGVIYAYAGGRSQQALAYVMNFHKHQKINRPSPSRLPPPPLQDLKTKEMYANRDGWRCHLCSLQIDKAWDKKTGGDFLASPDHLTPVSLGGSDYPSNIKTSHLTCNIGRGNRTIEHYRELLRSGGASSQYRHPERFTDNSVNSSVNGSLPSSVPERERERERDQGSWSEEPEGEQDHERDRHASAPNGQDGEKLGSDIKRAGGRNDRGTRLPDGWQPDDELRQFARDEGLDPTKVAAAFADYWRGVPGAKGRKLDWSATFRNWCRRDNGGSGPGKSPQAVRATRGNDPFFERLAIIAARDGDDPPDRK